MGRFVYPPWLLTIDLISGPSIVENLRVCEIRTGLALCAADWHRSAALNMLQVGTTKGISLLIFCRLIVSEILTREPIALDPANKPSCGKGGNFRLKKIGLSGNDRSAPVIHDKRIRVEANDI
jgi:hypothetical protein